MKALIVGYGNQGRKRQLVAGESVIATVDPFQESADYRSVEEVPLGQYDAAFLCVPDDQKPDLVKYLLSRGKHILVEKPLLAKSAEQFEEFERLARDNSAVCYTAYNHRFEPHIVRMKELIESGRLGNIYLLRVFYGNGTARDVRNSPWRDKDGGVVADIGSHLLDMLLFLFGEREWEVTPTEFRCFENASFDYGSFSAQSGNLQANLEMTMLSWRNTFRFDVFAENGSAHIDCLCKWGPSVFIERKRVLPSGRPTETIETLEMKDPTWAAEYQHFLALCQSGRNDFSRDRWINEKLSDLFSSWDSSRSSREAR